MFRYNVSFKPIRRGKMNSPMLVYIGFKSYITLCKFHGLNRVKEPERKETVQRKKAT